MTTLKLPSGSATAFKILLRDENGEPEVLTEALEPTDAVFSIRASMTAPALVTKSVSLDTLAVNGATAEITGSLTEDEAALLKAGHQYLAGVALRIDGAWIHSSPFFVEVLPAIASVSEEE